MYDPYENAMMLAHGGGNLATDEDVSITFRRR